MNRNARTIAFGIVVLAASAATPAGIDTPLADGDRVAGTLMSAGETATFHVTCPAGANLAASVKGVKSRGAVRAPAARLAVFDVGGAAIGASRTVVTPTGAALKGLELAESGTYAVVVSAEAGATGDYQLVVTWKSPTKFPASGDLAAGDATISFAADAGAVAAFDVLASRGSSAHPRLLRVDGPDAFAKTFDPTAAGSTRHRAARVALTSTGDYVLRVGDGGAAGGPFRGMITIKPPRAVSTKLELNGAALGGASDRFALVTLLGPAGGTSGTGAFGEGPIAGASVAVPAGALASAVSIVVGTGAPIDAPGPQQAAAGRTVSFGPAGLRFLKEAVLTIPFDPAPFRGDFSSLQVFMRDARGRLSQVTAALAIDALAGTVSFPSSRFGSYRAFGPSRPVRGDLNGDGFADLVIPAPDDLGIRGAVLVYFGRSDFVANPPAAPDREFSGLKSGEVFGSGVATGDVNGDGVDDLLVGSPGSGQGKVSVFFGGPSILSGTEDMADATLSSSSTFDSRFGAKIVVADVTGDGKPDAIVASRWSSRGAPSGGAVYVFPGGSGFASASSDDASVIRLTGQFDMDYFGSAMAAGDLTGDGVSDLAVGAIHGASGRQGRVFVFAGGPSLASQQAGATSIDFDGIAFNDHFGEAVAIADLNQDGVADLAVGAPHADEPGGAGPLDRGEVHVFFGGVGFSGRGASTADRTLHFLLRDVDHFGSYLATGNVIGNATQDLLVGAPGADTGVGGVGRIYLIRGGTDFVAGAQIADGIAPGDRFGVLLTPVDLDGDGRDETIAASPDHEFGSGRVDVRFGPGLFSGRGVEFLGKPGQLLGGGE